MTSAKRTAADPKDLDVADAVDEVEEGSKAATAKTAKQLLSTNSTFASRRKAAGKRVSDASNKAVRTADTK